MVREHVTVGMNKRGEKGLFASKDFKNREIIFNLEGGITQHPTKYSIEVGDDENITDEFGQYLNHSCEPSTTIERIKREVCATRDIAPGEELTFDYNSNEAEMASPFRCKCGAKNCQQFIEGRKKKAH